MVIFYDEEGNIKSVENIVNEPSTPANMSLEEKTAHYIENGLKWEGVGEADKIENIFDHIVILDEEGDYNGIRLMTEEENPPFVEPEEPIKSEIELLREELDEYKKIVDAILVKG